jgi:hypothetical protein
MHLPSLIALIAPLASLVSSTALTYKLAAHEKACFFTDVSLKSAKVAFYFAVSPSIVQNYISRIWRGGEGKGEPWISVDGGRIGVMDGSAETKERRRRGRIGNTTNKIKKQERRGSKTDSKLTGPIRWLL